MSENAFPEVQSSGGQYHDSPVTSVWSEGGLTKRELFAAMAMQGYLSDRNGGHPINEVPKWSIEVADALIAELAKEKP